MSNCEYIGDKPVFADFKSRYCQLDHLSCYNYDVPELVEKCPTRRSRKGRAEDREKLSKVVSGAREIR